jgi:hypothetical protein
MQQCARSQLALERSIAGIPDFLQGGLITHFGTCTQAVILIRPFSFADHLTISCSMHPAHASVLAGNLERSARTLSQA